MIYIKFRHLFLNWLISWVSLIEDIIRILTFTVYCPWWSTEFLFWKLKKDNEYHKKMAGKK